MKTKNKIQKTSEKQRLDFELNQKKIDEALTTYLEEFKKIPSIKKLSELTGLSERTIYTHNQRGDILDYIKKDNKHLTNQVAKKLIRTYFKNGKTTDAKLLLQLLADFKEVTETEIKIDTEEARKKILEMFFPNN